MKKVFRKWTLIVLIIFCSVSLVACSSTEKTGENKAKPNPEKEILVFAVGTGDVGGTFYPVGSTIAKIMNDYVGGVKATVESTGGSVDNSRMVGSGELLFGMAMGNIAFDAMKGEGKFSEAYSDIRCLFATYPSVSQWIALEENGINSLKDLEGKKVAVGMPGSGSEVASGLILKASGIDYPNAIDAQYLGAGEGAAAVRDGHCVASHTIGGIPFGAYLDLSETKNAKIIPIDKETAAKIKEKYPYYSPTQIPANSYKGQTEPVDSIGVKCLFICNSKEVSDELAYEVTKAVWENMDVMHSGHASLKAMTKDFVASDLPVPLHPGAEKYWREVGVIK